MKNFNRVSIAETHEMNLSEINTGGISQTAVTDNKPRKNNSSPWRLFARELLRRPTEVAAFCPSSPQLARAVANVVPLDSSELVVELGGGTGIMIEALLHRGMTPERLVSVERSVAMANYLHQHFPMVRIIKGDALHLVDLLGPNQQVGTIISGLPLRTTIPLQHVKKIIQQIDELLPQGGIFVEYTYLSKRMKHFPPHFEWISNKKVWVNFPPAQVNVYKKH